VLRGKRIAAAGTHVAGRFVAPVLGLIGLLFILGGLALYGPDSRVGVCRLIATLGEGLCPFWTN
jgi:hypothetical protein